MWCPDGNNRIFFVGKDGGVSSYLPAFLPAKEAVAIQLKNRLSQNGINLIGRGSILPLVQNRQQFIVRASGYGCREQRC